MSPDWMVSTEVRVVPVDEDGTRLGIGQRAAGATGEINVDPDDSRPGFTDAMAASWNLLVSLGRALLVLLGALVPFQPFAALAAAAWWWLRRRPQTGDVPAG